MNCTFCNAITNNPKFCSKSCAASFNNKRYPKRKAKHRCKHVDCNKIIRKDNGFCRIHHPLVFLNLTIQDVLYKMGHSSTAHCRIRDHARRVCPQSPCTKCGYNKHTEVCHIKSISSFDVATPMYKVNAVENLVRLCPNCHWEFDNLPR